MSAIVVRFDGRRRAAGGPRLDEANLVSVLGTHGGPSPSSGGQSGVLCLSGRDSGTAAELVPTVLRSFIGSEHTTDTGTYQRLDRAFTAAAGDGDASRIRFSALAMDEGGMTYAFSSGWADLESVLDVRISRHAVVAARDSAWQTFIYSPRLWAPSMAALALFAMVSTAFATGTVRPSPPPLPTVHPGEPTPTPDTRPMLSLGGFQLLPPAAQATPTPRTFVPSVEVSGATADSPTVFRPPDNRSPAAPFGANVLEPAGLAVQQPAATTTRLASATGKAGHTTQRDSARYWPDAAIKPARPTSRSVRATRASRSRTAR